MAHKTLIDGTAYAISGGKTLIDGTAFSIKNGKTLVDGTAYEVGFAPAEAIVKVKVANGGNYSSIANATHANISIDGVEYYSAQELVVPIGTVITCKCLVSGGNQTRKIYLNGTEVSYTTNDTQATTYDYTVTGDVEIAIGSSMSMSGGGPSGPTQYITTTIRITEL